MFGKEDRRKQLVVDQSLQWRIVASVAIPLVLVVCFAVATQIVLARQVNAELAELSMQVTGITRMFLATLAFFFLAMVYQIVHALKMSNRVAGSAYRIRKTLEAFRSGQRSTRARLRRHDFNQDIAEELNSFLDWIEKEHDRAGATDDVVTETETPAGPATAATATEDALTHATTTS